MSRAHAELSNEEPAADRCRRFVPERFTPLFYTPLYGELTEAQRLLYNQLHGCYCNEQIMFLERTVAEPALGALLLSPEAGPMAEEIETFIAEERRHTTLLRALNRRCMPELYRETDFYFLRLPRTAVALLKNVAAHPKLFPMMIWLMFLEEERALFFGREIVRSTDLETSFVATHRVHLADEVKHVECDRRILAKLWPATARPLRTANARLLGWTLAEFFTTPKRANWRVVIELARQFPILAPWLPEIRRQLLALRANRQWNDFLHSHAVIPKTIAELERWPEFRCLADLLGQSTDDFKKGPSDER